MPLRGRVGRHASTGKHCQNWKSDQQHVIALLNRFPAEYGGAAGSLNGRLVAGIASDALYQAILRFQKHQVPIQTGFVGPGDLSLQVLERNAAAPAAPAPARPANQWDNVGTKAVNKALRETLKDQQLSHANAISIVRSTLSDGIITPLEMDDLKEVANTSKTLPPRSKKMLTLLAEKILGTAESKGPFWLRSDQHRLAAEMVCDFLERSGASKFPNLDRDEVGVGMLMRITNPGLLDQDQGSLCGPAALLFGVLSDAPTAYARYAIDLYEKGKAKIYKLEIEPSKDCRNYRPPSSMAHVDWLTMASLRDSENYFLDYDTVAKEVAGITLPKELSRWFSQAGFSDIRYDFNAVSNKGLDAVEDANDLFAEGYRVCLFIGANMVKGDVDQAYESQGSTTAEHWVVQQSPIDVSNGNVRLQVFTYGKGKYQIPAGPKDLSVGDFRKNFFGYVAAKW
jgi:hypothetical protein